jgi:hypothetical protein
VDNNKKLYPSTRSGGGVRLRIGSRSPVKVGRPGPGRPGLTRLRPHDADLGGTGDVAPPPAAALAPRPLVVSQAVTRSAYY